MRTPVVDLTLDSEEDEHPQPPVAKRPKVEGHGSQPARRNSRNPVPADDDSDVVVVVEPGTAAAARAAQPAPWAGQDDDLGDEDLVVAGEVGHVSTHAVVQRWGGGAASCCHAVPCRCK